ncbi:MAG: nickel pincer cofactor biosynthesis protein LarC [Nitrospinae bacterium]|nr:nickel pincer cofactor biosynthesis protein LarC [Nitrospinota bacterium]
MKIAYFDCSSGISGDMVLGALVDAGVDFEEIKKGLKKLGLKGYEVRSRAVKRGLIRGTKVEVATEPRSLGGHRHARSFSGIKKLIESSRLPPAVKEKSVAVFQRIARAEAHVHRTSVEKIHFHEVGAVDSIVDIVGGILAVELLEVDKIFSSPLNTGEGTALCEHGILPVPAPATLKLLEGIPCYSSGVKKELTTPTGAAMIGFLAEDFVSLPPMRIVRAGYGAGDHTIDRSPNFLRVIIGEGSATGKGDRMSVVETNIDDMNPEFYDHVMESLFAAGAVDVFCSQVLMKKNRPAVKLTALCPPSLTDKVAKILLSETSTFGVRYHEVDRVVLDREFQTVKTPYGPVRVKVGRLGGEVLHLAPEYDECKKIAQAQKIPVKKVYEAAARCAEDQLK